MKKLLCLLFLISFISSCTVSSIQDEIPEQFENLESLEEQSIDKEDYEIPDNG